MSRTFFSLHRMREFSSRHSAPLTREDGSSGVVPSHLCYPAADHLINPYYTHVRLHRSPGAAVNRWT
jgi:hypothetical protein